VGEEVDHLCRRQPQVLRVIADELDEGRVDLGVGGPPVAPGRARRGDAGGVEHRHQPDEALEVGLHRGDRSDEARLERQRAVDPPQLLEGATGVEHGCSTGMDELILAAERAKHGALGHAGGLGHLAGREGRTVPAQQRHGDLDERRAAFLGAQGRGSGGHPVHHK
jgi:hypothetical protein